MYEFVPTSAYFDACESLEQVDGVLDVNVVLDRPDIDHTCLEVHVPADYGRVPPRILRCIAEHDLGLRPELSSSRPGEQVLVVV